MTAKETVATVNPDQNVLGSHLQHLRREKGLSIAEVSDETKISEANLRAIEAQDYQKLPADTFTRGHITLYGNFLGVDGPQVAARFITERDEKLRGGKAKRNFANRSLAPKKLAEPHHMPSATGAVVLFAIIVVSFTTFCIYTSWNPFAFFTTTTKNLSTSVVEAFYPTEQEPMLVEQDGPITVHSIFLKDTEVVVAVDSQAHVRKSFKKDEEIEWQAQQRLQLEFSEPDSASLFLDTAPLPFPAGVNGKYVVSLAKDLAGQ